MNRLRELLANPLLMRRTNGCLAIFWLAMIPVVLLTGLKNSLPFLVGISLWALVAGHWSAWQAGVVAVAVTEDANVQDVLEALDAKL